MATSKKRDSVLWDIYRVLYKNSTPSANFDELVENAPIDEQKRKVIDFMAYSIDAKLFDELMESELKKHKLSKHEKQSIMTSCYLGCSPRSTND